MPDNSRIALGRFQDARRVVVGVMIALLAVIFSFGEPAYAPESFMRETIRAAGIALIVLGVAGRLWSTLYIGGRKASQIVSVGPYSVTRNPLYLFSSVAAAGVGAQMASFTASVVTCVLCILAFHIVILREEGFLRARFGSAFDDYVRSVPRFFPNPSLYRDETAVTFDPVLLRKAAGDSVPFAAAPLVAVLVEAGQQAGWLPVLFTLY